MPSKGNITQQKSNNKQAKAPPAPKPGPGWVATKTITHPEHHHTLNHLTQVAAYYSVLSSTSFSSNTPSTLNSITASRLQGELVRSAKTLSRKAVIRLDTCVKRSSCPRCDTVWVEGLSVNVRGRVSGPHDYLLKYRCYGCGLILRRPAPNLVPQLSAADALSEGKIRQAGEDTEEGGAKRERQEEGGKVKRKVSQRERRRTASIKRQLLHASNSRIIAKPLTKASSATEASTESPSSATPVASKPNATTEQLASLKLSRTQKRNQRLQKLVNPTSSSSTQTFACRKRRRVPQLSIPKIEMVTLANTPSSSNATSPPQQPPPPLLNASSAEPTPSRPKKAVRRDRSDRPQLPHFNDRVEGSAWDVPLTALHSHLSTFASETQDETAAYAKTALQYWEKAARSRGDHLVVAGVGKNGSVGPSVP